MPGPAAQRLATALRATPAAAPCPPGSSPELALCTSLAAGLWRVHSCLRPLPSRAGLAYAVRLGARGAHPCEGSGSRRRAALRRAKATRACWRANSRSVASASSCVCATPTIAGWLRSRTRRGGASFPASRRSEAFGGGARSRGKDAGVSVRGGPPTAAAPRLEDPARAAGVAGAAGGEVGRGGGAAHAGAAVPGHRRGQHGGGDRGVRLRRLGGAQPRRRGRDHADHRQPRRAGDLPRRRRCSSASCGASAGCGPCARWLREDREPTDEEKRLVLRAPVQRGPDRRRAVGAGGGGVLDHQRHLLGLAGDRGGDHGGRWAGSPPRRPPTCSPSG